MITIKLTEEEAETLFTGLTNSVDEMAEEIERLTRIEKTFDSIRHKIRIGEQDETTVNTNIIIDHSYLPSI